MIETLHYPALSMACICMLAAGFCERWPATHEREGFSGWPPCQRVAVQRKKLAANGRLLLLKWPN
jgi:hypothetical protein